MLAALSGGCAQHHKLPRQQQDETAQAAFDYEPATLAKLKRCVQSSDEDLPVAPTVDLGATSPRPNWQLGNEESAFFRAPARGAAFVWRGVEPSTLALRCTGTAACEPGGSRLRLADRIGLEVLVNVHWEPSQLPELAPGTPVTLDVDMQGGLLVIMSEGTLLLAVMRHPIYAYDMAREWSIGPFRVRKDHPVCTGVSRLCNMRLTALALRFDADGRSLVLEPTQEQLFEREEQSYLLALDMAAINDIPVPGKDICAAIPPGRDAFSILRE